MLVACTKWNKRNSSKSPSDKLTGCEIKVQMVTWKWPVPRTRVGDMGKLVFVTSEQEWGCATLRDVSLIRGTGGAQFCTIFTSGLEIFSSGLEIIPQQIPFNWETKRENRCLSGSQLTWMGDDGLEWEGLLSHTACAPHSVASALQNSGYSPSKERWLGSLSLWLWWYTDYNYDISKACLFWTQRTMLWR